MSEPRAAPTSLGRRFGLCAPTDAVCADFDKAIIALRGLGLCQCELRSVGGASALDLGADSIVGLRASLERAGLRTVLVDTDIGLVDLTADFARQLARLDRALEIAQELGASAVSIFAYVVGEEAHVDAHREVTDRLGQMGRRAEEKQVMLLVENLPGSYADSGARLGSLLERVSCPSVGAMFNPAGFAALKEHPFLGAFMPGHLKNHVRCLRIRDARFDDGLSVMPDQGNGDLRELVSALAARSYDGYFSLDFGLTPTAAAFRAGFSAIQQIVAELL